MIVSKGHHNQCWAVVEVLLSDCLCLCVPMHGVCRGGGRGAEFGGSDSAVAVWADVQL